MKAKDLAKILLENPDFEVLVSFVEEDYEGYIGITYLRKFNVIRLCDIGDIGYSDENIILDVQEID